MTETDLVAKLCAAIHRARYPDADTIETVRSLLNCYVVTAVGAAVAAYSERQNGALLEQLKAHVDKAKPTETRSDPHDAGFDSGWRSGYGNGE
jgi:hypothetical protein